MSRILFLDGTPNMTDIGPIKIGSDVKSQIENDMALELAAVAHLNTALQDARELGDNASSALFEEILVEEEDYLEGQLHAISQRGIENYLAQHLHKGDGEKA